MRGKKLTKLFPSKIFTALCWKWIQLGNIQICITLLLQCNNQNTWKNKRKTSRGWALSSSDQLACLLCSLRKLRLTISMRWVFHHLTISCYSSWAQTLLCTGLSVWWTDQLDLTQCSSKLYHLHSSRYFMHTHHLIKVEAIRNYVQVSTWMVHHLVGCSSYKMPKVHYIN